MPEPDSARKWIRPCRATTALVALLLLAAGCGGGTTTDQGGSSGDQPITGPDGNYTFSPPSLDGDVTASVASTGGTPLEGIAIDCYDSGETLILFARDQDKLYYPGLAAVPIDDLRGASGVEERAVPIIPIILGAITAAKAIHWLVTDPPEIDFIYNDSGLEDVCITGDLEDVVETVSLVSGGLGAYLHVGHAVASAVQLGSDAAQVVDFGFDTILSEIFDTAFDLDADYTFCLLRRQGEDLPLVFVKHVDYDTQHQPSLVSPANGATGVSTRPRLEWSCAGSEWGHSTAYHVYIGTDPNLGAVADCLGMISSPDGLDHQWWESWTTQSELLPYTTYYWQIVKVELHPPVMNYDRKPSPTWRFRTGGRTAGGASCP